MRRAMAGGLAALLLAAFAGTAGAQVSVELRGGGAIGNHAPAAAGLETIPGPSFAGLVLFRPAQPVALYATYARSSFGCEEGFCVDRDVTVTTTGWGGGVRAYPFGPLWLQAGLGSLTATVGADGSESREPPTTAVETAAGMDMPLFGAVTVVPAVSYRGGLEAEGRTSVVAAEVGVRIGF